MPWPLLPPPPPPPMPNVRTAKVYLPDLHAAVIRAEQAWNKPQLQDALRSARYFIEQAEAAMQQPD